MVALFQAKNGSVPSSGDPTLPSGFGGPGQSDRRQMDNASDGQSMTDSESPPTAVDAGPLSEAAPLNFDPTRLLQVETRGAISRSTFIPQRRRQDPATIYEVSEAGDLGARTYASIRTGHISNDCKLVRAGDANETALCSIHYRIGPYRHPKLHLHLLDAIDDEGIAVKERNFYSHKTTMETPFGELRWRYGGHRERRAVNADNLLLLEVSEESGLGNNSDTRWQRVAQLVRSDELRTRGTNRLSAGNGGRLMMDLGRWTGSSATVEQVEVLIVASCLVMLKKEVDRTGGASTGTLGTAAVI